MAHHYAGGSPEEAVDNVKFPENEGNTEPIPVPGSDTSYELKFDLEPEEVLHNGELIDAEVAAGLSVFEEVMQEYDNGDVDIEVFLGYAENKWTAEDMWQETDLGRTDVYSATETLEEEYGLIETDFGDVSLTSDGRTFYDTFMHFSEQA